MSFEHRLKNPRERIYLPELLKEVANTKEHVQKIAILRAFAAKNAEHSNLIRDFIQCVYHPDVVMELPEGKPPYTTVYADFNLAPMTLTSAFKRVPYFVKGHSRFIENKIKREQIFIQTLESMFRDDSELFLMVRDKKVNSRKYKTVNELLFREAFPGMLPPKEG